MLRTLLRLVWKRDSESAACVCIEMAQLMSDKDLRDIADYFQAVRENKKGAAP